MVEAEPFGPRLRASRVASGLSLSEFARRLCYSKGHVSRIETGSARPSPEFARRCDNELGAGGALAALVPAAGHTRAEAPPPDANTTWPVADGGRTRVVAAGSLDQHTELLATARRLGQVSPPDEVLPMLAGQVRSLRLLAGQVREADARAVAGLASRTAEYAGWMAQEAGDERTAMWWTDRAVRAAAVAGDRDMAAYALVRKALFAMYRGDPATTVALARRARSGSGASRRVLGLAAQREAQGHALAGDHTECLRALDVARAHLAAAPARPPAGLVIGTSFVPDPVATVTGWCLYDLGRPAEAAEVLEVAVAGIAPSAIRARARFGLRQALAHAAAGEVEYACSLTAGLIGHAVVATSATLRTELRRLAATLRRFPAHPEVRGLTPAIAAALRPAAG